MKKFLFTTILLLLIGSVFSQSQIEIKTINGQKYVIQTDTLQDGTITSNGVPSDNLFQDLNAKMLLILEDIVKYEAEIQYLEMRRAKLYAVLQRLEFLRNAQ